MTPEYTPPSFNYCDYRCDRCEHQEHCRVFKEEQERLLSHYVKGEDPNDPQIFMKDIERIFERTQEMIMKMAQEHGVDIKNLKTEEPPEIDPNEYVIYRLAHEYYKHARGFIAELENTGIPSELEEEFRDLVWYHTLIVAKSGRLVSGFIDEVIDDELQQYEEQGTIQVIQKGVDLSKNALEKMLSELPDHLHTIAHLLELLNRFEAQLSGDIRQKVG
jgi:hypothetical protein